jgi:hypothetical protein
MQVAEYGEFGCVRMVSVCQHLVESEMSVFCAAEEFDVASAERHAAKSGPGVEQLSVDVLLESCARHELVDFGHLGCPEVSVEEEVVRHVRAT